MQPWLRRAVTRFFAIIPAALTIYLSGESATTRLIIVSQIILSLQLPFAVIPLIHLTSDRKRMGVFANGPWLKIASWFCAVFILALNIWLVWTQVGEWAMKSGELRPIILVASALGGAGFFGLLGFITAWPLIRRQPALAGRVVIDLSDQAAPVWSSRTYHRILVPLDHSEADQEALGNALTLAKMHGARIVLLHVEEDVTSRLFGSLSSTAEIA